MGGTLSSKLLEAAMFLIKRMDILVTALFRIVVAITFVLVMRKYPPRLFRENTSVQSRGKKQSVDTCLKELLFRENTSVPSRGQKKRSVETCLKELGLGGVFLSSTWGSCKR